MNQKEKYVRMTAVEFKNIKNVPFGRVEFPLEKDIESHGLSNAFGIYGLNGSGKTSLISVLGILKSLLLGGDINVEVPENVITERIHNLISASAKEAKLAYEFICFDGVNDYQFRYECVIGKTTLDTGNANQVKPIHIAQVKKETLKVLQGKETKGQKTFFDIDLLRTPFSIAPESHYKAFVRENDTLLNAKVRSAVLHSTFVFSRPVLNELSKHADFGAYFASLKSFIAFGIVDLFVIDQSHNNDVFLNLNYRSRSENRFSQTLGTIMNYQGALADDDFVNYAKSLKAANVLLGAIVPGLQIQMNEESIHPTMLKNNVSGKYFELISVRGEDRIPMAMESNGIRSLFSVASLLISAYNERRVMLAIDELDSGVFEYLLGSILDVYRQNGKGLLVFTSHNLRPLEILGKDHIVFTVEGDRKNRFDKFPYFQKNENFRNRYLRTLLLEGDGGPFSFPVRPVNIRKAFLEASRVYDE